MPRTICFLIYEGFQILDMAGPVGAFEAANWHAGGDAYRLQIAALEEGLVSSSSGAQVQARAIADVRRLDTLIVVGGSGSVQKRHDSGIANALRRRSAGARRVCSVCSGAQLLAAAGLLDGKRATTHWRVARQLSQDHPEVRVAPDAIFTHDDGYWTSAGVSAGIDPRAGADRAGSRQGHFPRRRPRTRRLPPPPRRTVPVLDPERARQRRQVRRPALMGARKISANRSPSNNSPTTRA